MMLARWALRAAVPMLLLAAGASASAGQTAPAPVAAAPAAAPSPFAKPALMAVSMPVSDINRALAYYKTIGLKQASRTAHDGVVEIMINFEGSPLATGILLTHRADTPAPPPAGQVNGPSTFILRVPDVAAIEQQLVAAGYPVMTPSKVQPGYPVKVTHLRDPDGHNIELVQFLMGGK